MAGELQHPAGGAVSPWVALWAPLVPAGEVLDLACGSGRHAHFLAGLGHPVLALDRDAQALAMLAADAAIVRLAAAQQAGGRGAAGAAAAGPDAAPSAQASASGSGQGDGARPAARPALGPIVTMPFDLEREPDAADWPFAPSRFAGIVVTNYLHRPLFPKLLQALRPDGLLIYETFALGNEAFGKPSNPNFLLADGELLTLTAGLRPIAYEHGYTSQPKPALVQRLCAAGPAFARENADLSGH